jgi:putative endonuclease
MGRFYVYILKCQDNSFYTGYTADLGRRIKEHNTGKGAKYTRARKPVQLLYWENYISIQDAMRREREIKRLSREKKIQLMNKKAP